MQLPQRNSPQPMQDEAQNSQSPKLQLKQSALMKASLPQHFDLSFSVGNPSGYGIMMI